MYGKRLIYISVYFYWGIKLLGRLQFSLDFTEIQIFLVVNSMIRNEGRRKPTAKILFYFDLATPAAHMEFSMVV